MRTQLNLGGPLSKRNNNDKCTSVVSLKEARSKGPNVGTSPDRIYSGILVFAGLGERNDLSVA